MSKKTPGKKAMATRSVRAGLESDAQHGSVVPPIYLSTNFAFEGYRRPRQYDYTRSGNPTRDQLAGALADLEGGAGAVVTCTGLAAITLILATLPAGARVVAPFDCYGGTYRLLAALEKKGNLAIDFIDQSDAGALAAALGRKPALVWIETPSNPLLRIVDIRAVAEAAHAAGALVAADNTFLSPVWQQPLGLGADLVMHSTTKYLNGHSDVVGGAVIAATAELTQSLAWWANAIGVTGAPFDSFMTLRGVRTLHARTRVHEENTLAVVQALNGHAAVRQVYYPGLPGHPGHDLGEEAAKRIRRHAELRIERGRSGGAGVPRGTAVLHAGGIIGRRRKSDRTPDQHDARRHGRSGSPAGRDRPGAAAGVGGDRGCGRPGRGPRGRARAGAGRGGVSGRCAAGQCTPLAEPSVPLVM